MTAIWSVVCFCHSAYVPQMPIDSDLNQGAYDISNHLGDSNMVTFAGSLTLFNLQRLTTFDFWLTEAVYNVILIIAVKADLDTPCCARFPRPLQLQS